MWPAPRPGSSPTPAVHGRLACRCPPCKHFTPSLARTYQILKDEGKAFEVVFVSMDKSKAQFDVSGLNGRSFPWRLPACRRHVLAAAAAAAAACHMDSPWAPAPARHIPSCCLCPPACCHDMPASMTRRGVALAARHNPGVGATWLGMQEYFGEMPWTAVPYEDDQLRNVLIRKFKARTPPARAPTQLHQAPTAAPAATSVDGSSPACACASAAAAAACPQRPACAGPGVMSAARPGA